MCRASCGRFWPPSSPSAARGSPAVACATICSASAPRTLISRCRGSRLKNSTPLSPLSARPMSSAAVLALSSYGWAPLITTLACRDANLRPATATVVSPSPPTRRSTMRMQRLDAISPSTRSPATRLPANFSIHTAANAIYAPAFSGTPVPPSPRIRCACFAPFNSPPALISGSPPRPPPFAAALPRPSTNCRSNASGANGRNGPRNPPAPPAASRSCTKPVGSPTSPRSPRCTVARKTPTGTRKATSSPTRNTAVTPSLNYPSGATPPPTGVDY